MPFRGYLDTRYLRHIKKRSLLKPFTYITWDEETIIVPKDFLTDGASIPKLFRPLFGGPWSDENFEPSVIHDWLCELAREAKYSRRRADSIFSQTLAEKKKFSIKRKIMWFGVRLGSLIGR